MPQKKKPPLPRPRIPVVPPQTNEAPAFKLTFQKPRESVGHRIVLYGPGGIGKTTLAADLPGKTAIFDLDESIPKVAAGLTTDIDTVPVSNWAELRGALAAPGWDAIQNIVIDSGTVAQEWAERHVYETVKGDKGMTCLRMEDYGWGKGYRHVFDEFTLLLSDLDRHARQGRNVCLVCHEALFKVTNPEGEDFSAHEPKLQDAGDGGKASIKLRVRDWADHLLCMLQDVAVDGRTGKAKGQGTRTIYPNVSPFWMAKHRGRHLEPMPVTMENAEEIWTEILG